MVRIGTVWDRTTEVIAGRFAILAAIALLLLFVPSVVQAALDAFTGRTGTMAFVGMVVGLLVGIAAIVATLALTAVATDPAVDQPRALAIGGARLGPAIAIVLLLVLLVMLSAIPGAVLLYSSGIDVERARAGLEQVDVNAGRAGAALLYFFVILFVWLWLAARLVPLMAIVVNERLGLGAVRRSFALTRGSTLKLIGVMILYGIVTGVCLLAASSIVGLVVRLILGAEAMPAATFAAGIAAAAVTAVFSVIQCVFAGQFYVAAREARDPA